MCGIFGMYLNRPLIDEDIKIGEQGLALLRHRGPDASNTFTNAKDGIFLGHNRLSIIDDSEKSNQPMEFENQVIVYNGELYNYKEVAKKLIQNNITLKTDGDTEVLFKAWIHWGKKALDFFDGMYAFVVYCKDGIYIVTDGFGEKPMYWYKTPDGVYFSSEPEPLIRFLKIPSNFNSYDIVSFLGLGFLPGKETGFLNLSKVEPGSIIHVRKNGTSYQEKYWQPASPVGKEKLKPMANNDIEDIINILIESLKYRLRADVPLSLFLSSGIDSTLVAALATKELKKDINAFTVSFSNSVKDETANAKRIAKYLKLNHEIVSCENATSLEDKNLLFEIYGELNDNLTALAAYRMSLLASNKYKVALTGIGADEFFYGYGKYHYLFKYEQLKYFIKIALSLFPFLRKKYSKMSKLNSIKNQSKFLFIKNSSAFDWLSKLPQFETFTENFFSSNGNVAQLSRYFDLTQTMPYNFIPALERASMKASLEIRTPFLNRKLFEIIENLDISMLLSGGQKSLLKNILSRYLPTDYFEYPKVGFIYPYKNFINYFTEKKLRSIKLAGQNTTKIWDNIDDEYWQRVGIRVITLDHFLN